MSNFEIASILNPLFGEDLTAVIFSFLKTYRELVIPKTKKRYREPNRSELDRIFKKARNAVKHICQSSHKCPACNHSVCKRCESNPSLTTFECDKHHICLRELKCPHCHSSVCEICDDVQTVVYFRHRGCTRDYLRPWTWFDHLARFQ